MKPARTGGPIKSGRFLAHVSPFGARVPSLARNTLLRVRDMVLPAQCLGCAAVVEVPHTLCSVCWVKLKLIGPAVCKRCGFPFPYDQDAPLCGSCVALSPPFARARSAAVYDEGSRHLVMAFKHADRPEAANLFARWLSTAAPQLLDDAEVMVPVPLDRRRLFNRRYNQAALIAQALGKMLGITVCVDALERIRPTSGQGRTSPAERFRNVAGAFRVRDKMRERVAGRRVLVIDDVYTTGATAWAVSRELNRAGVAAVDVLTVTRAVRD